MKLSDLRESFENNVLSLYPKKEGRPVKRPEDYSHTNPNFDGSIDSTVQEDYHATSQRNIVSIPATAFDGYTGNDYQMKIFIYRSMALSLEISKAVSDIVNEAIVMDDPSQPPVQLNLDNVEVDDKTKKAITESFEEVLTLLKFNKKGHKYFKDWYVDARINFEKIIDKKRPKDGLKKIKQIPPENITPIRKIVKSQDPEHTGLEVIKRVEKYFLYNPTKTERYYRNVSGLTPLSQNKILFKKNAICDVNSDLYDQNGNIISYLDKAIRPFNMLRMMEDSLVVYRLTRAPERRLFYIETGDLPRQKAEQYVKDIADNYRNKIVFNGETGTIKDAKNTITMQDDFWLPQKNGQGTKVDVLPGGENLGQISDVEYFQNKLYDALDIPKSRQQQDTGFQLGRATEITRDEVNFKKFIGKLRIQFSNVFLDLLKTHMLLKGEIGYKTWERIENDIIFDYANDSFFYEMKQLDVMNERMQALNSADAFVGRYFSIETLQKTILGRTDEEVKEERKLIDQEKKAGILVTADNNDGYFNYGAGGGAGGGDEGPPDTGDAPQDQMGPQGSQVSQPPQQG